VSIVGGLDVHRQQITFDYVDADTGLVRRGKLAPADRTSLREWLATFRGLDAKFAVEGCTGWRFVAEECARAGVRIHLADPGDAAAARGRKRHAKTDQLDARHLRQLLAEGRLPESWIPPEQVLEVRARVRLYKDLQDERGDWLQRVRATCFHQGLPARRALFTAEGRAWLETTDGLSDAGRQAVMVALRQLDRLDDELTELHRGLVAYARRQPGCRALWTQLYGVGGLTSVMIWAELGTPAGSPPPGTACATPAWISPCTPPTANVPAGTWPGKARRCCAGRCLRPPSPRPSAPAPTTTTTPRSPPGWGRTGPPWPWPASSSAAPTTCCASSATRRSRRPDGASSHGAHPTDDPRPAPARNCRHRNRGRPEQNERPRPRPGVPHRSSCRRAHRPEHRDKSGRPRASHHRHHAAATHPGGDLHALIGPSLGSSPASGGRPSPASRPFVLGPGAPAGALP